MRSPVEAARGRTRGIEQGGLTSVIRPIALGHVTVTTRDLPKSLDYYAGVDGLAVNSSTPASAHLVLRLGKLTVSLVQGDRNDCRRVSFEVAADTDFADTGRSLATHGVASDLRSDPFPGAPHALCLRDVNGVEIELLTDCAFISPRKNVEGIGPLKLGHVAFYVADMRKTAEFFEHYCEMDRMLSEVVKPIR